MGNDEAHEAQQAAEADGGACQGGGQHQQEHPHPADREAQALGRLRPKGQHIQLAGQAQGQQHGRKDDGTGGAKLAHGDAGEASDAEIGIAGEGIRAPE